ncbi:MAG: DUF1292 domain-containing protein [Tissierellia bacterium]|nr:DUF1292 domain-containing protein [Tissierellia bacterium]
MNEIITLLDELGNKVEFELIATFGLDEMEYAALIPVNDNNPMTYLLRIEYDENGELVLVTIDDQEEFRDVVETYEEIRKEKLQ